MMQLHFQSEISRAAAAGSFYFNAENKIYMAVQGEEKLQQGGFCELQVFYYAVMLIILGIEVSDSTIP